jgi:hypothetical protein
MPLFQINVVAFVLKATQSTDRQFRDSVTERVVVGKANAGKALDRLTRGSVILDRP